MKEGDVSDGAAGCMLGEMWRTGVPVQGKHAGHPASVIYDNQSRQVAWYMFVPTRS